MSDQIEQPEVILGVDTHLEVHVAVLIDVVGRVIATTSIPTTAKGYEELIAWASSYGRLTRAGIEGTGTYGAALARCIQAHGIQAIEINRPDRSRRRFRGKSDPADAENAARAVLAGDANATPKSQSGVVEAMRALSMARRSAVKAKTQAINQLRALLITAPDAVRASLWKSKPGEMRNRLRSAEVARRHGVAQGANQLAAPIGKTLDKFGRRVAGTRCCVRCAHAGGRSPCTCAIWRRTTNRCHVVGDRGRQP